MTSALRIYVCIICGEHIEYRRGSPPRFCVACRQVRAKANSAELKARYHSDPEWKAHMKALAAKGYERNKEAVKAKVREYATKHQDKRAEASRRWSQNNKAKRSAFNKAWKIANPEAVAAMDHNRRMRIRGAEGKWTQKDWKEVLAKFGGVCPCCGTAEDLTIDHIVPIAWGGNNFPWNLQPLCSSSNYSKADYAIADYLPWNGESPRLAFYEYLGPAPKTRRRKLSRAGS